MKIILNGDNIKTNSKNLQEIILEFELDQNKVAIELNYEIISQGEDFSKISLKDGDRIELVEFVGGG